MTICWTQDLRQLLLLLRRPRQALHQHRVLPVIVVVGLHQLGGDDAGRSSNANGPGRRRRGQRKLRSATEGAYASSSSCRDQIGLNGDLAIVHHEIRAQTLHLLGAEGEHHLGRGVDGDVAVGQRRHLLHRYRREDGWLGGGGGGCGYAPPALPLVSITTLGVVFAAVTEEEETGAEEAKAEAGEAEEEFEAEAEVMEVMGFKVPAAPPAADDAPLL
ncbi:hypothetical protein TYRP_010293 [Tyrophagus putrescentiae]|nr:hypothetical protein TYRP_010293 [Tyrophagus putrescentiae]